MRSSKASSPSSLTSELASLPHAELELRWAKARADELEAVRARQAVEDELTRRHPLPPEFKGKKSLGHFTIEHRTRLKVDVERLQIIALDESLGPMLGSLFRWSPEVAPEMWELAPEPVRQALAPAVQVERPRPRFELNIRGDR